MRYLIGSLDSGPVRSLSDQEPSLNPDPLIAAVIASSARTRAGLAALRRLQEQPLTDMMAGITGRREIRPQILSHKTTASPGPLIASHNYQQQSNRGSDS